MALFKISRGKSANLPANKVNGYCYVTIDEHKLYVDYTKDDGTLDRFALNAVSADKWKTARNLNGMVVNGTSNVVNYGTCSTAAATAAKVVSCSNFSLITGAEITVKFTTTNTAANPTLNVNGTGAKAIYYRGSAISAGYLAANRTYTFRYNGTQYELVGDLDTNTDTKNTAGSTDTSSKIFLIGATSQAVNPQTYSHDTAYVGTDGCLYSNNTKVSVNGHTHSPNEITDGYTSSSFYINTHPENSPTIIPFINNDIAFLTKRGGSAVVKCDNTTQSTDISNVFDGSGSYWSIHPTNITTITIELTLHKVFTWTNIIYIDSGSNTWRAKNMKIEVMNTDSKYNDEWTTKGSVTDYGRSQWKIIVSHTPAGASNAGGGFNKIRFTFSNWNNSTGFRIACLGVINYGSSGIREISLPRDGGTMYGGITPYINNSYNLGSNSNKYANVYATNFQGNATTATKLATARTIALTGSVTGSGTFDGSGNLSIATTTSHNHDSNYVKKSGDTMTGQLTVPGFFYNSGDATLKVYASTNTTYGNESISVQTAFDGVDGQTHDYVTQFESRCNLLLQPRGGQVYISKNQTSVGDTAYALLVGGPTHIDGNLTVPTVIGNLNGNANSASKVNNKLTVGGKTFDGSAAVTIAASDLGLASAMLFLGTTTTAITDGATTNPVTIGGASKTVTAGNVVLYGSKEFAWTGSAWEELGNEGSYKIVQAAVADPTASGTSNTFISSISQDTNGKITATKKTVAVTNNAPTLSWGTTSTIGSVAGTNLQVKMPANPNTDTKVTQTVTSSDASYPLLLAPNGQTTTTTTTSYFNSGVTLNPSTKTITATTFAGNLRGNADTATKLQTARTISLTGSVTGSGTFDGSGNLSIATTTNHSHSYLPLSGGTMTGDITMNGDGTQLLKAGTSSSWINGRDKALIRLTSYNAYSAISSMKTTNGSWDMGVFSDDWMYFTYCPDTNYNAGDNSGFTQIKISPAGGLYGAVWNDYAEFRICNEDFKPGRVVCENGDDTLSIASQRLQRGCSIISDTFGFAIGETDEAKCPIAVSGRVLAYGYESREEFAQHIGWPVCSGPNGTVSIMTEEEEEKYSSRIIGTISAVPDYDTWGTGDVSVNGRIWIKIR